MGKCPLCGSDGDDLVFRFYCSNEKCANFVPGKGQEKKLAPEVYSPLFTMANLILRSFHGLPPGTCYQCGGSGTIPKGICPNTSIHEDCVCPDCGGTGKDSVLPKGEVFRLSEPEFVGSFPVREDVPFAPKDLDLLRPGDIIEQSPLESRLADGLANHGPTVKTGQKPLEGIEFKVDKSPSFRIASIKRPLPTPPPSRIFSLPFTYREEVEREFEPMKEQIFAGLGVPREFLEPDCGRDFPRFKLVVSPFNGSLQLFWDDRVPSVLNILIAPILEDRIGTPATRSLEGTTQHRIIQRLLDMVRQGQLVRNEIYHRWELHFTE